MRFFFVRTPKPRQFNYIPRYYDPEKEAREERRRELLGEDAQSAPERYQPGQYVRNSMLIRRGIKKQARKQQYKSKPIRLVLILILLGLAVWWALS